MYSGDALLHNMIGGNNTGEEQDREFHRHHPGRKQREGLDMFFRATFVAAAMVTAAIESASPTSSSPRRQRLLHGRIGDCHYRGEHRDPHLLEAYV